MVFNESCKSPPHSQGSCIQRVAVLRPPSLPLLSLLLLLLLFLRRFWRLLEAKVYAACLGADRKYSKVLFWVYAHLTMQ